MSSDFQIRTGTWDDEPTVGALMALAFATDPFVRWILPDPHDFVTDSLIHAGVTTAPAFDEGTVYMIGETHGAAVWIGPDAKFKRKDRKNDDGADMPEELAEQIITDFAEESTDHHIEFLQFALFFPAGEYTFDDQYYQQHLKG